MDTARAPDGSVLLLGSDGLLLLFNEGRAVLDAIAINISGLDDATASGLPLARLPPAFALSPLDIIAPVPAFSGLPLLVRLALDALALALVADVLPAGISNALLLLLPAPELLPPLALAGLSSRVGGTEGVAESGMGLSLMA